MPINIDFVIKSDRALALSQICGVVPTPPTCCTRYSVSSNVEERMLGCIKRPESFAKGRVDSVVIVTSRPHHRKLELKAQIDALASYCIQSAALSERSTEHHDTPEPRKPRAP